MVSPVGETKSETKLKGMKKILRILAVVVLATSLASWVFTGANRGWTKTSVAVKTLDEVTGLEGITYQKKFSPGIDFLGACLGGALLLAGASIFLNKSKSKP